MPFSPVAGNFWPGSLPVSLFFILQKNPGEIRPIITIKPKMLLNSQSLRTVCFLELKELNIFLDLCSKFALISLPNSVSMFLLYSFLLCCGDFMYILCIFFLDKTDCSIRFFEVFCTIIYIISIYKKINIYKNRFKGCKMYKSNKFEPETIKTELEISPLTSGRRTFA